MKIKTKRPTKSTLTAVIREAADKALKHFPDDCTARLAYVSGYVGASYPAAGKALRDTRFGVTS